MISRKQTDHHLKNGRFQYPFQFCGYREIGAKAARRPCDRMARAAVRSAVNWLKKLADKQIARAARVAERESA